MKKKIGILSIVFVLLISISFIIFNDKKEIKTIKKVDSNMLAIMLEDGVGTKNYEKSNVNSWPSRDYVYNEERSYCEKGSTITWDDTDRYLNIETRYAEQCYIYFDRYRNVAINGITTSVTGSDSIKVDVSASAGTNSISRYYYCISNCSNDENWVQDSSSHTFTGLTHGNTYNISVKVKDTSNVYSSVMEEEVTLTYVVTCSAGEYLPANSDSCSTCAAGSYCPGGSYTYDGTQKGMTACATGSYSASTGSNTCTPCPGGNTNSGTGNTSCVTTCSNNANVATWATTTWSNNTVSNLCVAATCASGYTVSGNNCIATTYVYWNATQGGSGTVYASNTKPTTTYQSYTSLGLSQPGILIRTTINGSGTVLGHETCLYYNNKIFCLGPNYWTGTIGTQNSTEGTNTENKLKTAMEASLGTTASSCSSNSNGAYCYFGSGRCSAYYDGDVYCYDGSYYCYVYRDGRSECH